ncbi:MAG TPA: rhomboid family intramembrane serine protease [Candidatus Dormibacteraeota bacterium]|nr:rhomboid family intramembrane serine protease [Candidatus Dormibacteraeota bacterium]
MSSLPGVSRRRLAARGAAELGSAALSVPSRLLASMGAAAATWALVLAMLAVWCLEQAVTGRVHGGRPIGLLSLGALPNLSVEGRGGSADWWRYVSSALLHQSFLHLAGNGIGVLVVGTMVERLYGRLVTLATFTLTAVAAGGLWVAASSAGLVPLGTYTVGASAGLCGLIGLLVMFGRRPHTGADLRWATTARIRALTATGLLLLGGSTLPSVNNLAHAAGLTCGLLLGAQIPPLPGHGGRPLRPAERALLGLVLSAALLALALAGQQLAGRLLQPGR